MGKKKLSEVETIQNAREHSFQGEVIASDSDSKRTKKAHSPPPNKKQRSSSSSCASSFSSCSSSCSSSSSSSSSSLSSSSSSSSTQRNRSSSAVAPSSKQHKPKTHLSKAQEKPGQAAKVGEEIKTKKYDAFAEAMLRAGAKKGIDAATVEEMLAEALKSQEFVTVDDVISQQLPVFEIYKSHTAQSSTKSIKRHYPELKPIGAANSWLQKAKEFHPQDLLPSEGQWPRKMDSAVVRLTNGRTVEAAIARNIGHPLSACQMFGTTWFSTAAKIKPENPPKAEEVEDVEEVEDAKKEEDVEEVEGKKAGKKVVQSFCDFAAWTDSAFAAAIDVETPWSLDGIPVASEGVADMFNKAVVNEIEGPVPRACKKVIGQTCGDMLDLNCRHGIVSSYEKTWFLELLTRDQGTISEAVLSTDPNALRCWAYFLHQASNAKPLEEFR